MKKLFAIFLVICMMMTFASFPTFAATVATTFTPTNANWGSPLKGVHTHKAAANSIDKAVDGDYTTHFTSDQYNGKNYNLVFELDTPGTLDTLKIEWGGTAWGHMPAEEYKVSVAGDDEVFREILSYTGLYTPDTAAAAYPGYTHVSGSKGGGRMDVTIEETDLNEADVRYVKIAIVKSSYNASVREISATVVTDTTEPEAPALGDNLVLNGAQIRLPESEVKAGLRFAATIKKSFLGIEGDYAYDANAAVTFGMFLLPADMLGADETLEDYLVANNYAGAAAKVPAVKVYSQDDETVTFTAVLTDIPATNYDRDIVAVPYVCTDATKYELAGEETRNFMGVAEAARNTTYSDAEIAKITDETLKAKMQAIADDLDEIINSVEKTKVVVPAESAVYAMGRTYNYNELLHAGAVYEYKCTGSVVGAVVSGDSIRFDVSIDGGDFVPFRASGTTPTEMIFAKYLDPETEHTVRIVRASDIWASKLTISGVVVTESATVVDNYSPDYDLKIEFVGDSITSGTKTDTCSQSYAYLTAKALNANYNVVSRSGLGLHQNANNGSGGQLPSVYASVASGDGGYKYDYDPDLVILNIGTNDGANVNKLDTDGKAEYRAAFKEKYVDMLETIHTKNPNATILCTGGLMGDFGSVKTQITEAVELFKTENPDAKVYCEFLSVAKDISADTSWHPGIAGHAKGAEELVPIVKRIMNIQ